jgi:hypothetical protein
MATVTFVAQVPGTEADPITRSSGTMPYVAYTGGTWHKSFAAAYKASTDRYHGGTPVYPVVPVKFNGKPSDRWPETVTEGWGDIPAATMRALLADKLGLDVAEVVAEEAVTEVPDVDAAEAILAEGVPTEDGGLRLEAEPAADFYVTRDTADHMASDETRAMAHVRIAQTTELADAQYHLQQALLGEAGYLTRNRDITQQRDVWAFRRAAALAACAYEEVPKMDPSTNPGPHQVITRTVEGLLFSIVRRERPR